MPIQSVDIYYTQQGQMDGLDADRSNTIHRFWHHAAATRTGSRWVAELPLFSTDKPLWVYANVVYPLGKPVTGAGYYYRIYTADRFNLSSLMRSATVDELKAAGIKAALRPSLMLETFEHDWEKEWFTYNLADWGRRTHKVHDPQWAAPDVAELGFEVRSERTNTLVVAIDHYGAEVQLTGKGAWQTVALSASDFMDAAGVPMSGWTGIKELRLGAREQLKDGPRGDEAIRTLGGDWTGAPPEFRELSWQLRPQ
jgi:hypothetical protein